MSLYETIQKDHVQARRDKDEFAKAVLSVLVSDLKYQQMDAQKELEDADVITVIQKTVKQKQETKDNMESAGRSDEAAELQKEIDLLDKYLPEALSEDKLREIALQVKEKTGASSPSDMGLMMKEIMPLVKGQADGSAVKKVVMEILKS